MKYQYKVIDLRKPGGFTQAEKLKEQGWKINVVGIDSIQFERIIPTKKKEESKHTPGPWRSYNTRGNSGRILKQWIIGARYDRVAKIEESPCSERNRANARLIASAPELLKYLKEAIANFDAMDTGNKLPEDGDPIKEWRKAVAEAEGKGE